MTAYDLLAIGRVGVDLYPLQHGMPLDAVRTFEKFLGGTAANVTVAAARLGRSAALISRTGDDVFGRFLHRELLQFGVDDAHVGTVSGAAPTPVTFYEVFPPDHFPIWYYRYPTAPDLMIEPDSLPLQDIRDAKVFWATLTGLSQEPSRAAHFAAWEARERRPHTVLDLDYRPDFWESAAAARAQLRAAMPHVSVVMGSLEECQVATGLSDARDAGGALVAAGAELVVIKEGSAGILAMTPDRQMRVPGFPVQVVNGLGAGDAIGGALAHGLLSGWDLERILNFANVAGAIVAARPEGSAAMPTTAEVQALLADVAVADGVG